MWIPFKSLTETKGGIVVLFDIDAYASASFSKFSGEM